MEASNPVPTISAPAPITAEISAATASNIQGAFTQTIAFNIMFAVLLVTMGFFIYRVMLRSHKDGRSPIDFSQLLINQATHRMDPSLTVMFASLLVTSFIMIYTAFKGTLTDLMFGGYLAAWVAPTVTVIIKGEKPSASEPPKP